MEYIHYGEAFDRAKFLPIKNGLTTKPQGGFWVSRADAPFGWKEWVKSNQMDEYGDAFFDVSDDCKSIISLKEGARILVIDSVEKADIIERTFGVNPRIGEEDAELFHQLGWFLLDFEQLAEKYDAVECAFSADTRLYKALYTWDCDSTLILNPDIVQSGAKL